MTTLTEVRNIIKENKSRLNDLGIIRIGIFGSYIKGRESENSDIDILIDLEKPPKIDLLEIIDLENKLSEQLGTKVDLVLKSALRPSIGKQIMDEVEYVD